MTTLLRKYELYVGQNAELTSLIESSKVVDSTKKDKPKTDIRTIPKLNGFKRITDLHFEGTIVFDREGSGSKTQEQKFAIYNPSKETREYLNFGNLLILKAGYNTDAELPIICATEIVQSFTEKSGSDIIVHLSCSEAYSVRRNIKYNVSFPKKTPYSVIVRDILDTFASKGVPTGRFLELAMSGKISKKAKPFSTTIYDALTEICEETDYRWFIASGLVYVTPKSQDKDYIEFVKIVDLYEDNVKNSIEPHTSSAKKTIKDTDSNKKGIKATVNLNGDITEADGVNVTYGDLTGKYIISKVTHKLSYEGQYWDTEIECKG